MKKSCVYILAYTVFLYSPDFDDDGTLDVGDLKKLVNCLTGETGDTRLNDEEMKQLIGNVSSAASHPSHKRQTAVR